MKNPFAFRLRAWVVAGTVAGGLPGAAAWSQTALPTNGAPATTPSANAFAATSVTLAVALDAAWQRAVAARESEAQRDLAIAERSAAGSLWAAAPSLELSHRSDRWQRDNGWRESEIGVVVPLWLPGQQAARGATADAAAMQAEASARAARLRLAGDLREVAWALAERQAEADAADAHAQVLRQLADDVERRVRAGDLARADSLAAQAELLAAVAQRAEVRQRMQLARARWTLLTGLALDPELRAHAAAARNAADAPHLHPELLLASESTEHARRRLDLVQSSRRDAPELLLGVRQDVAGRSQLSQGSVVLGLRFPFGTDDRNKPREAAALGELAVAQAIERQLRDRVQSDIASARGAVQSAQAQLDAETARERLLRERAALIDRSYRAGESALPDLLRALASAAQADSTAARQRAALGLADARLQQALGLLP
ncbi:MAG: TolC family protein [Rubrivivax sp.]